MLGRDSFQEIDIVGVTYPIVKHSYMVKDVSMLADTVREAMKIAQSGRPGPVLIDIPKDIQIALAEYTAADKIKPLKANQRTYARSNEFTTRLRILSEV